jgi:hypothetical protein
MSETKTYEGGCHCGRVRFRATTDLSKVYACNCSMCSKMGWRLAFVPEASFTLLSGSDALTDYQFHKKHIHHVFCSTCGVRSFGHGPSKNGEMYSVNVRCLDGVGVEAEALPVEHFDGRSL